MFEYKAKVTHIVDGDTVDFDVDLGFNIHTKIRGRLLYVNTPERGHPDWYKATDMLRELLTKQSVATGMIVNEGENNQETFVMIKSHKTGKYGRWLVEIDNVNNVLAETWPYVE